MKIEELLKKAETVHRELRLAISGDLDDKVYDLDQALSVVLREILEFEPQTSSDRKLLGSFLIELLVPEDERGNFQDQVIHKLKDLL
ncbi:MAG: hypothetical protein AAGA76_04785 [Pseudomonadota bacterium]